jgi:hypothetical protein
MDKEEKEVEGLKRDVAKKLTDMLGEKDGKIYFNKLVKLEKKLEKEIEGN